jgi:hypothetical protein
MEKGIFSIEKMQEPEDNMRYAERKAVSMMNNGLNNKPTKQKSREKKDFEILKTKESNRDKLCWGFDIKQRCLFYGSW